MLSGEGVGVIVLKRRADAERDGDRIYSVVQGVGISSDGRGLGLASPSAKGHARAIRRAYRSSGIEPASVGLIEGHGLGVPAADRAELRAIRACFPPTKTGRRTLGAVSERIGHAMPASGIAGLIKTALTLHHRWIPGSDVAEKPHSLLRDDLSPVALNSKGRPWIQGGSTTPRRAGVNAFGFAGINTHAILEEHSPSADSTTAPGALLDWDSEAILISAQDRDRLVDRLRQLRAWLTRANDDSLKDLAFSINTLPDQGPCKLGFVVTSLEDLAARIDLVLPRLIDPKCRSIRDARGTYFWSGLRGTTARLAFLFPGEGSQYPGMLADLCPHFPEVRALFDTADRIAREGGATRPGLASISSRIHDRVTTPHLWSAEAGSQRRPLRAVGDLYRMLGAARPSSLPRFWGTAAENCWRLRRPAVFSLWIASSRISLEPARSHFRPARGLEPDPVRHDWSPSPAALERRSRRSSPNEVATLVQVAMDNCPHQVVIAGASQDAVEIGRGSIGFARRDALSRIYRSHRAYHTPEVCSGDGTSDRPAFIRLLLELTSPNSPALFVRESKAGCLSRSANRSASSRSNNGRKPSEFRRTIETMSRRWFRRCSSTWEPRGNLAGFVEDTLRGRDLPSRWPRISRADLG